MVQPLANGAATPLVSSGSDDFRFLVPVCIGHTWFRIYSYSTTAPVLADETFREYLARYPEVILGLGGFHAESLS